MSFRRQLVVNADDFGFTPDVNAGIVEAHRHGILTSTTLMANGDAFEDAVRLARENPDLDIGCHLVLVGGRALAPPHKPLPGSVSKLVGAVAAQQIRVYDELSAQVRRILSAGILPTHLDTHKHTHLLPPVLDAVARISQEFQIRWVRRPFDFPLGYYPGVPWLRKATNEGLSFLRKRFDSVLRRYGCHTTDHFAGFQITGLYSTRELVRLIHSLPDGCTEFMCHPGYCGPDLRQAHTRLRESRVRELEALIAPETQEALRASHTELVSYRELSWKEPA